MNIEIKANINKENKIPVILNWSGGKDAALALHTLQNSPRYSDYQVVGLLTAANAANKRSSLHGIPNDLLELQALHIGLPIEIMYIPDKRDLATYEACMKETINAFIKLGVKHFAFGDIHLEEVKNYREKNLQPMGATVIEPLWKNTSNEIIRRFLASGLKAMIMTGNSKYLDNTYLGQLVTQALIDRLPETVDQCGENGEYHSFCFDGPIFKSPVPFIQKEIFLNTYEFKDEAGNPQVSKHWQLPLECPLDLNLDSLNEN